MAPPLKQFDDAMIERIKALRKEGLNVDAIACEIGVDKTTFLRWRQRTKFQLTPLPRGRLATQRAELSDVRHLLIAMAECMVLLMTATNKCDVTSYHEARRDLWTTLQRVKKETE